MLGVTRLLIANYALRPVGTDKFFYVCITPIFTNPVIAIYALRGLSLDKLIATYAIRSVSPDQLLIVMHFVPCHNTSYCYLCITFPVTTEVLAKFAFRSMSPDKFLLSMH